MKQTNQTTALFSNSQAALAEENEYFSIPNPTNSRLGVRNVLKVVLTLCVIVGAASGIRQIIQVPSSKKNTIFLEPGVTFLKY